MRRNGHGVGCLSDKGSLAGPTGHQAVALELAVRLEHRVRVDGELRHHFPGGRKLVTGLEPTNPDCPSNLLDNLPVGGDPGRPIEAEFNHCAMRIVKRSEHSDLTGPRQAAPADDLFSVVPKWPWGSVCRDMSGLLALLDAGNDDPPQALPPFDDVDFRSGSVADLRMGPAGNGADSWPRPIL